MLLSTFAKASAGSIAAKPDKAPRFTNWLKNCLQSEPMGFVAFEAQLSLVGDLILRITRLARTIPRFIAAY
jgi:hypothetical protein